MGGSNKNKESKETDIKVCVNIPWECIFCWSFFFLAAFLFFAPDGMINDKLKNGVYERIDTGKDDCIYKWDRGVGWVERQIDWYSYISTVYVFTVDMVVRLRKACEGNSKKRNDCVCIYPVMTGEGRVSFYSTLEFMGLIISLGIHLLPLFKCMSHFL